jgi:hypothetical protein
MDSIGTTTRPCSASSSVTDVSSAARTVPSSRRVGASLRIFAQRDDFTDGGDEVRRRAQFALQPGLETSSVKRPAIGSLTSSHSEIWRLALVRALEVDPARLGHDDVEGPLDHFQVVEVESEFG